MTTIDTFISIQVVPRWLQILIISVGLFALADIALRATGNPNFFPTILLLGAFAVPVTFVAYFYEHIRDRDISLPLLATCFLVGGAVGLVAAGVLEFATLQGLGVSGLLGVGFIEEAAKLIFPVIMFLGWRYRHEADGLLFGVAAGMGFAALETMGYGLVALIQSQGDVASLQQVLLLRGLLSPAGHAAWTGLVCAMLWRERGRLGHASINARVISFFLLAVVLHAAWDIINGANIPDIAVYAGMVALAVVSLGILILRYREARRLLETAAVAAPVTIPEGQQSGA